MAVMMIPILAAAMPEIIKLIGDLIEYIETKDSMTPEQAAIRIADIKSRKDAALARVAGLEVRDV